jgi:hypothetical protein
VDADLHQETTNVLGLLSRVQQLFGGDAPPVDPPAFTTAPGLEADLGRARF